MIEGYIVKTKVEPCQHHERNVYIGGVAKEWTKYMQSILEENAISIKNNGLRMHTTCQ